MTRKSYLDLISAGIAAVVLLFSTQSEASISVLDDTELSSENRQSLKDQALFSLLSEVEIRDARPEIISLLRPESDEVVESDFSISEQPDVERPPEEAVSIEDRALSALLDEIEASEAYSEEIDGVVINLDDMVKVGPQAGPPNLPDAPQEKEVRYDVPIHNNELVEKYITLFQTRLRPHFEKWLARSGLYIDMMREILREHELPEDLVYLALIESGFNPKAFSRARASGPWQFIKGTGKKYGLRIDPWIDERRDPVKATHAAARYLKDLYGMFGSWPLAMASYNAGEGRVSRAVRRTKTRDFWELRKSRYIHRETKNYIPKFMAATIISKDPERHRFSVDYHDPWVFEEVEIEKATYLSAIAKYAGVSVQEIRRYNPELKRDVTPPRAPGYRIKLPVGKRETFLANYSPEDEEELVLGHTFKHRVRRGETISSIARKYGVSIDLLLETNRLRRRSIIRTGQYVLVTEGWNKGGKHRIRRGESISTIALRYNVSMRDLLEANRLHKKSVIRAGDTLIIPDAGYRTKHTVRRGETISAIARKYAVRQKDLLRVNRLKKAHFIRAGRTLIIP